MRWTTGGSSGNIEDKRGMRFGGGGMGGMGGRLGIGGFIVLALLSLVFKKDFFQVIGADGEGGGTASYGGEVASSPAEDSLVQFVTFVFNDAQAAWSQILPAQSGGQYREARLVLFRDVVESACGTAQTASGPFYCSADERVYIDLGFYNELEQRFGAPGDFAQAYVLAHEVGHHVQNVVGTLARAQGGNAHSVQVELQADCYAGVWANTTRERRMLDPGDVEEGLGAASSVGDDRIQEMGGGRVNPETFTHGSAAQRSQAFRRGFDSGRLDACR